VGAIDHQQSRLVRIAVIVVRPGGNDVRPRGRLHNGECQGRRRRHGMHKRYGMVLAVAPEHRQAAGPPLQPATGSDIEPVNRRGRARHGPVPECRRAPHQGGVTPDCARVAQRIAPEVVSGEVDAPQVRDPRRKLRRRHTLPHEFAEFAERARQRTVAGIERRHVGETAEGRVEQDSTQIALAPGLAQRAPPLTR
jgi:hypothetical protein